MIVKESISKSNDLKVVLSYEGIFYAFLSRDDDNPRRVNLVQIYSVDWTDDYDTQH